MALIPFNRKASNLALLSPGFENFYNMLDDFFNDSFMSPSRNLLRDSFKIDVQETETAYLIEAEIPGIKKEEIDLSVEDENLCISVNRAEEANHDGKNYIHRERRAASMSRRVRLAGAKLEKIKAKLSDGVLAIMVPKDEKTSSSFKINIE